MAANKIYIQVDFQSQSANQAITTLNKNIGAIGAAASQATIKASAGIDGMTSSMLKAVTGGNLLSNTIQTALQWLKQMGADAVLQATQVERMQVATEQLAKANGIALEAVNQYSEAIQRLGIEDDKALEIINQMILANIHLSKTEGLAKMAKDLAALRANMDVGEAFDSLVQAIEYGNERALRALGLRVEFDKRITLEELKLGRALSENEKVQIRLNEVTKAGAKATGAGAAIAKTAEGSWKLLTQEFRQLRQEIGAEFLGDLRKLIESLRDLVKWVGQNREQLKDWAKYIAIAGAALVTYKIAAGITAIAESVKALNLAMAASKVIMASNPIALLITGGVAAGAILWNQLDDIQKGIADKAKELERRGMLQTPKTTLEQLRKSGLSDAQIREKLFGPTPEGEQPFTFGPSLIGPGLVDENLDAKIEAFKKQAETVKRVAEATKQARASEIQALDQLKDAQREYTKFLSDQAVSRIHLSLIEADAIQQTAMARELALKAHQEEIANINEAERREIEQRSQYIDEKGKVQRFQLSRAALVSIHNATLAKIAAANIKYGQEEQQREEAIFQAQVERLRTLFEINQTILEKRAQRDQQLILGPLGQQVYEFTETTGNQEAIEDQIQQNRLRAVEQRTALELAALEQVNAVTVDQKIALERRKTEIEIQAIRDREAIELQSIKTTTGRQIAAAQAAAIAAGNFNKEFHEQLAKQITALGDLQEKELTEGAANAVVVAQAKVAAETQRIIIDHNKAIYDNLKDQAGRVFDALLQKSTSVWQAIANIFKVTILTAIREVVTSQVARMLYGLFNPGAPAPGGGGSGGGGGGAGGALGVLQQALGFGGMVAVSATTAPYSPNAATVTGIGSADRMMDPDIYNLPTRTSAGTASIWSQISGARGPSTMAQVRENFNIGKTVVDKFGRQVPWSSASPAAKLGSVLRSPGFTALAATVGVTAALAGMQRSGLLGDVMTVGGAALTGYAIGPMIGLPGPAGAILGAGVGLFARGVQRGGAKGLAMTTAGGFMSGAMLGLRFGGIPGMAVGAIVGTAVGAITGTVRLFIKGADEKLRQKIREVYGIDMRERNIRAQILQIAKDKFGGNLDLAVRSPEVQEMVTLYSLSTGQNPKMPRSMYGVTAAQSGAGLAIQPVYSGGRQIASPYVGATQSQWQTERQRLDPKGWYIQLDPQQAVQLFQGQVVNALQSNPAAVAQANATSVRNGGNRNEQRGGFLEPSTVVA